MEKAILLTKEKLIKAMEKASESYSDIDLIVVTDYSITLENILFGGDEE